MPALLGAPYSAPPCELIDFAASAKTRSKAHSNLNAALHEGASLAADFQARLMTAQIDGLMGWDARDAIEHAREGLERMQKHLAFCAALAERAQP